MKKFKNIKLMLLGLLAMGSMNAFAADGDLVKLDNLVYKVTSEANKQVKFIGLSATPTASVGNSEEEISVPATINTKDKEGNAVTYSVKTAHDFWYLGQDWDGNAGDDTKDVTGTVKKLTFANKVVLSATAVSRIFEKLNALVEVHIGDARNVETVTVATLPIASQATLETVDLSGVTNDVDGTVTIANGLFKDCIKLKKVILPTKSPVIIGEDAFRADIALGEIELAKVVEIGARAFQAASIKNLTIPAGVEVIGEDAFNAQANPKMESVTFSADNEKMTKVPAVFGNQKNIKKVVVSGSATTIDAEAFKASGNTLAEIDLSGASKLTSVGKDAFASTALVTVKLEGTQMTSIPACIVPTSCTASLKTFTFPEKLSGKLVSFNGCGLLEDPIVIPAKVNEIDANGFKDCVKLTKIDFAANSELKTLGASAFEGCVALKTAEFTKTPKLEAIPNKAFYGCKALEKINLASTRVKSIGSEAFRMTLDSNGDPETALTEFTLCDVTDLKTDDNKEYTASLTIGGSAFRNCSKLESIGSLGQKKLVLAAAGAQFANSGLKGAIDLSGADYQVKSGDNMVYQFTEIPTSAFQNVKNITSVSLPKGIATINMNAFTDCEALATVTYAAVENLAKIGGQAFEGCALTEVDLSGAVGMDADKTAFFFGTTSSTGIFTRAFANNKKLETVKLPAQMNWIGAYAFADDIALKSINLNETDITILPNIFTFYGTLHSKEISLDKLEKVELVKSDKVKVYDPSIKKERALNEIQKIDDYAFQLTGIKEFTMPETATYTSTGRGMFRACTNLTTFTWKNALVSTLGPDFFRGDVKLTKVYFLTKKTCTQLKDDEIFMMCNKDKLTVYVTADSYNAIVADGWGNDNRQYSTLAVMGNKVFEFTEKNLASDGYYYATYYDYMNSAWFDASEFDVYAAVIEGGKVVLKPATADGGYYKVARLINSWVDSNSNGLIDAGELTENWSKAICVVRSKNIKAVPELNSNGGSDALSTLPTINHLRMSVGADDDCGSKLNYVYKLGRNKSGVVAFYRITSGDFAENTVYINAEKVSSARAYDALDMVIEGESTGIKNISKEVVDGDDAPVYNLQGVRVNGAHKGIYIKNGKKYVK